MSLSEYLDWMCNRMFCTVNPTQVDFNFNHIA